MRRFEYNAIYMGHGALNIIDVWGEDSKFMGEIVIDAGSNQDALRMADEHANSLIENVMEKCGTEQLTICLTHLDQDHYSYIVTLLKTLIKDEKLDIIDKIYIGGIGLYDSFHDIGSIQNITRYVADKARPLYNVLEKIEFQCESESKVVYLGNGIVKEETGEKYIYPCLIWGGGWINLYVLFSSIAFSIDKNTNPNSANFALTVRGTEDDKWEGIWFTGDSTGRTFKLLGQNKELCNKIHELFRGCSYVFMTVPHHGSINTLCEDEFAVPEYERASGISYISPDLKTLLNDTIGRPPAFILSAAANDDYKHPSGQAMKIYGKLAAFDRFQTEYERYRVFCDKNEECAYLYEADEADEISYTQFIEGQWVKATCYFYENDFHADNYCHKWDDPYVNRT